MLSVHGDHIANYNNSMHWGTYRPNIYFGTRTRSPSSLLTGLIWFGVDDMKDQPWNNIRHSCDQGDGLLYGWNKHNGRNFGSQTIKDTKYNVQLNTEFIKIENGEKGGNWSALIRGQSINGEEASISLIYYLAFDGADGTFTESLNRKNYCEIKGFSNDLGDFVFEAIGFN
jgi:mannosyl-oligosaccharide glucosidase